MSLSKKVISSAVMVMLLSACAAEAPSASEQPTAEVSPSTSPSPEGLSGLLTGTYRMAMPQNGQQPTTPSPSETATLEPVVTAEAEDDLDKAEDDLSVLDEYTGVVDSRGFEFSAPVALYSPGNLRQDTPGEVLQTWTTNKDNPEAADAIIVLSQVTATDATDAWGAIKEFPDAGGQGGTRHISNLVVPGADSAIEIETPGDNEQSRARTILAYKDGKAYLLGASGNSDAWAAHSIDSIFASFQVEQ